MKYRQNRIKDLTNKKFGRLQPLKFVGRNNHNKILWLCKCDCGNEKIIVGSNLKSGISKSCGCIKSPNLNEYYEKLKEKIYSNIKINGDCWEWQGKIRKNYPHGIMCASLNGKKGNFQAHRISYQIFKGEIPTGLFVLHSCDNGICLNPEHLHLGTQKDNMREMRERGRAKDETRGRKGEKHHKAKLKSSDIVFIKILHKHGIKGTQICKLFDVSSSMIYYIVKNQNWKHI